MSKIVTLAALALLSGAAVSRSAMAEAAPPPVFDVHMHAPLPQGYADWEAAMTELNVSHAVLIGVPSQLESAPDAKGRFLPSLMFPCENGKAANIGFKCFADGSEFPALEDIRRLAKAGKLRALGEVTAQYAGIAPDDARLAPYFALAEELDLPVGIHLGAGPAGVAFAGKGFPPNKSPNYRGPAGDPMRLEDVLVRHPKLRLYVMHAAWPFRDHMTYMLDMYPNLYVDVSVLQWTIPRPAYYAYLRDLVETGFGKRIMFGSDGGVRHLRMGVEAIQQADFLTAEQKRDILHDNAARFFRLESASPAKAP